MPHFIGKMRLKQALWTMAVDYSTYLYNHFPNDKENAPAELFTGSMTPRRKLKDIHIFGYPVYVLDPVLQAGKKLSRWKSRYKNNFLWDLVLDTPAMCH